MRYRKPRATAVNGSASVIAPGRGSVTRISTFVGETSSQRTRAVLEKASETIKSDHDGQREL